MKAGFIAPSELLFPSLTSQIGAINSHQKDPGCSVGKKHREHDTIPRDAVILAAAARFRLEIEEGMATCRR